MALKLLRKEKEDSQIKSNNKEYIYLFFLQKHI